jgi:hypothetical protein
LPCHDRSKGMKNQIIIALYFITFLIALRSISAVEQQTAQTMNMVLPVDHQNAHKQLHSKMVNAVPAPQDQREVELPADVIEAEYTLGPLHFKVRVSKPPAKEKYKFPAVLLLHRGNTFELGDRQMTQVC